MEDTEREGGNLPLITDRSKSTALMMETGPIGGYYPPLSAKKGAYFVQSAEFQPLIPPAATPFPLPERRGGSAERGKEEKKSLCKRMSGSALCKATVIVYLLSCVLVSALYVALYGGPSQKMFAASDAWIPGKPTAPPKHPSHSSPAPPPLPPLHFVDAPYTEWISQRWTHANKNFSNWPSLPPTIDTVQQVSAGSLGKEQGVWLITDSALFFALNLDGGDPDSVQFIDIGVDLDLDIVIGSRVAVDIENMIFVATPFNITLLDCSSQEPNLTCFMVAALLEDYPVEWNEVTAAVVSVSDGQLWLGTDSGLYMVQREGETLSVHNVSSVTDRVTTLAWRSSISSGDGSRRKAFIFDPHSSSSSFSSLDGYLAMSGSDGIHSFGKPAGREPSGQRSLFGLLVVGTRERVHFLDGERWWFEWVSVWSSGQGGLVDGSPTSLTFVQTGDLFIGNNVSLTRVHTNYTFDRLGPLQGLPYNQILSLHHSPVSPQTPPTLARWPKKPEFIPSNGTLWIGTARGFTLYDVSTREFQHYFYGNRWHPGEMILGFASGEGNSTVVVTDEGVAVMYPELWTLEEKAKHYQAMLDRHTRSPGLVADCDLTNYVPDSCSPHTTDNDGLWTSIALGAEAFRYQVTGDREARENAWQLFTGMQFLNNVTGIKGLMARSVVTENVSVSGGTWHNSTSEPGWKWKGDTSSDEVVGHMFAYPLIHDLVASTAEERNQARELVDNIVGYIHNNSYYLIDVTNESTRWGVWNPQPLNFNQSWSDEHGLNSLQILTYLLSAYRITAREEYALAWANLSDDNGLYEGVPTHYGINMVNQKITFPRDDNYSDDELAFLPYFTYFFTIMNSKQRPWSLLEKQMNDYITLSIQRAWRIVEREKSALWTAIYAYAMDLASDPDLIEMLVWNLRTWPLELVEWNTTNSHRLDITFNPEQDRNFRSESQSEKVLPANERTQLRWNGNPFLLDSGGGDSEMDPGAWLLPYWMARWTKML